MTITVPPPPSVLVLSESAADAELVRQLLREAFPQTQVSTDEMRFADDVERLRPQVLVLAFRKPEIAERHVLALARQGGQASADPIRTVLLCDKEDLRTAYELCRRNVFDDYMPFWPMAHDANRLPMAVHLGVRAVDSLRASGHLAQIAAQARRIGELESQIAEQVALGRAQAQLAQSTLKGAQSRVEAALESLCERILSNGFGADLTVGDPQSLRQELARVGREGVAPPFQQAAQAMTSVSAWIDGVMTALDKPLRPMRALVQQVRSMAPLLMVVEDDDFQRKLLSRVLEAAGYEVEAVVCGADALRTLRSRQPVLILMDIMLPDIGGIDLTRQLRATEAWSAIPVIMLTGRGEKQFIVDSRSAGAVDFVVKPFDRETLLKKVARHIGG